MTDKKIKNLLHKKYTYIICLYNSLKKIYSKNEQKKPLVAQLIVKNVLESLYLDPLYEKLYREYYVYYSLFSQNTNDVYTKKTLQRIFEEQKRRNFVYEMGFYRDYFYKHKDRNIEAMPKILETIKQILSGHASIEILHKIKGLGFKSSALLYNEFVSENEYPVIDVHVIKSYNFFSSILDHSKPVSAQFLYKFLVEMERTLDLNISYDFCSMLYYHRKFECSCKNTLEVCCKCKSILDNFKKKTIKYRQKILSKTSVCAS